VSELFSPLAAPFRLDGHNGEAVVMVHGFTGVPAHWRLMAPIVHQAGFTVSVPRLAGHGTSIDHLSETFAEDWLDSVRTAIDEVSDRRRVHLIGLSMGGLLSLVLAAERQVATVTTINTPMRYRNWQTYAAPYIHRIRPRVMWPEHDDPGLDDEAAPLWLTYDGFPTRQLGEVVRLARRARKAASKVTVPALVIQSKTDESVDASSALIIADAVAGPARIVWLEASIHNSLLDRERDTIHAEVLCQVGGNPTG